MRQIRFRKAFSWSVARRLLIAISVFAVASTPSPLYALDEGFFAGNDILFYDPDGGCATTTPSTVSGSTTGAKGNIKVAHGNILNHAGEVNLLVKNNPDFVSLNETSRLSVNELKVGGYGIFRDNSGNNQSRSTAVLWKNDKWSKVDAGRILMVKDGPQKWDAGRAATWVTLKDSSGGTASMVSVHHMINPNKFGPNRELRKQLYGEGMDRVVEKVRELAAMGPVVIAGDFNFQIGDDNGYGPRNKFSKINVESTFDSLGRPPNIAVDYVFYTKDSLEAKSHSVLPKGQNGSDHPYLFATLTANGSGSGADSVVDSSGCVCEDPNAAGRLTGADNAEKIWNYFKAKGLSDIQSAGIIGNMSVESGFDPQIIQGGGRSKDPRDAGSGGWGLIQWTPGSKILGLARQAGLGDKPIYELATQLDLVWGHMNNKPPITTGAFKLSEFKIIDDVEKAVEYFEHHIEGAGTPNYPDRYTAANLALDQYGGGSSTSPASSSDESVVGDCDSVGSGAAAGNAVQTAINYAWPEYHAPNFTQLKPEYAAAVSKAQSEGRYVGGGPNPGVDCGGFITLVMQDSGVDSDYGGGGNTTSQERHLATSGKYKKINNPTTANLTPGAIAISSTYGGDGGVGHTYMYVGTQPGFETQVASASYSPSNTSWRAPMAGHEVVADPSYDWYVLK